MHDVGLTAAPALSAADQAVKYLLDRIQFDADLRYLMLDTEAFALLCRAEAERRGESGEVVQERRSKSLIPKHHDSVPRLVRLRALVEWIDEHQPLVMVQARQETKGD